MMKFVNKKIVIVLAIGAIIGVTALSGDATTDPPVPRGYPGVVPAFMGGGNRDGDRRWLARARPLGRGAPAWARRMHRRSLLVLRAVTDPATGAAVAGARAGWAYVWPRDAAAVALAFAAAGYRQEARQVARFLLGLDLDAAARFRATGEPVPVREAQGDAAGWVAAAARAAGLRARPVPKEWRDRADYQEGDPGDYLGNAISSGEATAAIRHRFAGQDGLARTADDPGAGLDSAAAWVVRPFRMEPLYPSTRETLLRIAAGAGPFGILPSEGWLGGEDPWTAPTAWTAWSLAALGMRGEAQRLIAALRRASTPLGLLPERVDVDTGAPRSTTPLAWSHAFAILAIRELWPGRSGSWQPI